MIEAIGENKEFLRKYNINNADDLYRESTLNEKFPLYIDMSIVWPKIETLAEIMHKSGGKIFLAHPYKYAKGIEIDTILNSCLSYLDGIEVSNEPKNAEEINYLYNFAKENNLLISAGSDYHGSKAQKNLNVEFLTENMENEIEKWIEKIDGKIMLTTLK